MKRTSAAVMLYNRIRTKRFLLALVLVNVVLFLTVSLIENKNLRYFSHHRLQQLQVTDADIFADDVSTDEPVMYVAMSVNTPNGANYRGYDYTFPLPLNALAWERVGFRSVFVIIGSRCQWENDPVLKLMLSYMEERKAVVIFMEADKDNWTMLSQNARIFTANLDSFPGKLDDFLMMTDSDQWPLHAEHFRPVPGKPHVLVSLHPDCCQVFQHKGKSFQMLPMGNIGTSVASWRQILNDGHAVAKDAKSIIDYYVDVYGESVRGRVSFGSDGWWLDQQLVSIRIGEWREKYGNDSVYRPPDGDYVRLDRVAWNPQDLSQEELEHLFDAHLLSKVFLPDRWNRTLPLMKFMYGENSWQMAWAQKYYDEFRLKVKNYIHFNETDGVKVD